MKKLYSIIFIIATVIGLSGCDSDRDSNPTLSVPDSFVLNIPPYVSGVYDLENTSNILLTCSQPDYGFTAATSYKVQVSLTKDFAKSYTLPTSYNTAKMQVIANEFAVGVCTLMVDANGYDEDNFPIDELPIFVRLVANLGSASAAVTSNVVELPKVKPYFALPPMVIPAEMYLNGTVFGNGDWSKSVSMVPVWGTPGKFWALQYFGTDKAEAVDIKFNSIKDANEGTPFSFDAQIDDASKALAGITTTNNKLTVGKPGWYIIVVSTEIQGRNYIFHLQFLPPKVYSTGDPSGGYDVFDDTRLFKVPAGLGEFESPAFVKDGDLRICIKLANIDWWKTEFVVLAGKLEYRGNAGDQKRTQVATGQKVFINFTDATGSVK